MGFLIPVESADRLKKLMPNAREEVIESLYMQCAAEFADICCRDDVPETAAHVVEQMVSFRLSQLDAEGLASQSFSGASEAFLSDYPERLKRAMYRYRRLRTL